MSGSESDSIAQVRTTRSLLTTFYAQLSRPRQQHFCVYTAAVNFTETSASLLLAHRHTNVNLKRWFEKVLGKMRPLKSSLFFPTLSFSFSGLQYYEARLSPLLDAYVMNQ